MIPKHIAIIPDGNRRYGKKHGLPLHKAYIMGMEKANDVMKWSKELGIKFVTIWGFSTENFNRNPAEKKIFFSLMETRLKEMIREFDKKSNIRVKVIGRKDLFPAAITKLFNELESKTAENSGMQINFAVGYGGRQELIDACNSLIKSGKASVTEGDLSASMYTTGIPDPELIIRTSGETRLSGFLPWQAVYSEFVFLKPLWPELGKKQFVRAVTSFGSRERRFGK